MSVQAMEWARRQMVGDALAKSLLRAFADYADEHGHCWPSIARLAADCEVSEDTIRRKTKLLEDGDYLVRIRAFVDDLGRRNTEGRGRETSSEIRLRMQRMAATEASTSVMDSAPPEGEGSQPARVAGSEGSSLRGSQVQTHGSHTATPGVAVERPPNEPSLKKEESRQSPPSPGGATGLPMKEASDGLERFKLTHPRPSQNPERVESIWATLSADERARARRGAEGVKAYCAGNPKLIASVLAADKFLATPALWEEFARRAPPPAEPTLPLDLHSVASGSVEFATIAICCAIAGREFPKGRMAPDGLLEIEFAGDIPAGVAAFAALCPVDRLGRVVTDGWIAWPEGTPQCAAWRDRVAEWLGKKPETRRFWLDREGAIVPIEKAYREPREGVAERLWLAKSMTGLLVPATENGFPPPKGARHGPDPPAEPDGTGEAE